VATLLEGSVSPRRAIAFGVNVQLINANNDEHIWRRLATAFDRRLAIQTDLAQKIASALQAKLSPNEKARLDRDQPEPDAYLLFVQAHDYAIDGDVPRHIF